MMKDFKLDYKMMRELLELKDEKSARAMWYALNKKLNEQLDSGGTYPLQNRRATDTIDASSPPKKSSRLDDNFTQDESTDPDDEETSIGGLKEEDVASEDEISEAALAGENFAQDESTDPDDEEMSIGGLKKEDVGNEDDFMEAVLAGEPSGMEMVSEDVEEGAIKAEEEDEADEAGMGLDGSVGGGYESDGADVKVKPVKGEELSEKEHIKIENEELVGVDESVDVQRGDDVESEDTGDEDIAGSGIEDSKA
ncbi:hypothetical protein LTS10_012104 [Elasticomyces elasticus]|nr:hypothetical protein LTS10_012104 [Elasticomyces elasticus]